MKNRDIIRTLKAFIEEIDKQLNQQKKGKGNQKAETYKVFSRHFLENHVKNNKN